MIRFGLYGANEHIEHDLLGKAHTLTEVIEGFRQFLLGAGYKFPKGVCLGFEEEDGKLDDSSFEPSVRHACNNSCCTGEAELRYHMVRAGLNPDDVPSVSEDRCPHDPVTCRGKELGTCGECVFTKPENCT